MKRKSNRKRGVGRIITPVVLVICCIGFVISAWKFFSILHADRQAESVYSELRIVAQEQTVKKISAESAPVVEMQEKAEENITAESRSISVDITGLKNQYPELAAWLRAEGTGIDYPVMHAKDNDFYLSHLYDGTYNYNGSIFVDYRNTGVLTDGNTVIYGHNINNGGMFNPLNEYKSQEFYDTHPAMTICTTDGDYRIELICGTVEDGNYEFVQFNFDDFDAMNDYVNRFKARSTFESGIQLQPGDRLVSLCTCTTYSGLNARYMLVGRVSGTPDQN